MKKLILMLCLSIILLSGCSTFKAIKLVQQGKLSTDENSAVNVPFELKSHAIIVQVNINDSAESYSFILDTGAMSIIDKNLAKKLGIKTELEVNAKGSAGNKEKIQLVKAENISIGGAKVYDCPAAVFDMKEKFGEEIKGIIGSNFLRFFTVSIDYSEKQISLSRNFDEEIEDNDLVFTFNTHFKNGFAPIVKCMINNHKSEIMINTGTSDFIGISNSLARKITDENNRIKSIGSMSGDLFGSSNENYITKIHSLKINSFEIDNFLAVSSPTSNSDIVLGKRFLSQYKTVINYPDKKLILKPLNDKILSESKNYGIGINKNNGKTYISGVWKNSNAELQGLLPGNEILKINDLNTENLSLLDISEILYTGIEPVKLTLKNDDKVFIVSLSKESLNDFFK